jgi:hypothetical protein
MIAVTSSKMLRKSYRDHETSHGHVNWLYLPVVILIAASCLVQTVQVSRPRVGDTRRGSADQLTGVTLDRVQPPPGRAQANIGAEPEEELSHDGAECPRLRCR